MGERPLRRDSGKITVFSPFGLGILDICVSKLVVGLAEERGSGQVIDEFLPASWAER